MSAVHPSLTPMYPSAVNEPIPLYRGPGSLTVCGRSTATEAVIRFNFLHPQGPEVLASTMLSQRAEVLASTMLYTLDAATELSVPSEQLVAPVLGRSFRVEDDGCRFVGILDGDVETGSRSPIHRLVFHVANMPFVHGSLVRQDNRMHKARICLDDGTWHADIDAVPAGSAIRPLAEQINEVGGFAITHVGALQRVDGTAFAVSAGQAVLHDVRRTRSFARAGWASPFLMAGVDGAGQVVWRSWSNERISPFCEPAAWFSPSVPGILDSIFRGWRAVMSRPDGNVVNAALDLYLDAHVGGLAMDSQLVLVQSALEGLGAGWPLVAKTKASAAQRIQAVGQSLGLAVSVPATLPHLAALAEPKAASTVFERVTWLRNSVAHLGNFDRLNAVSWKAKYDATQFLFWVLELALLRLLDADGQVLNRLTPPIDRAPVKLPWKL